MSDLDKMLRQMEEVDASELYLMVGQRPKFRIEGDLALVEDHTAMDHRMLGRYLMELINEDQREILFRDRDLYFVYEIEGKFRYRCNYFFQQTGYGAVIRPIPLKAPTFAQLKLPPVFQELAELPGGLVLIAGPPGCGKTTTMAAIVGAINENQSRHILIVENPLEFLHKNKKSMVTHREIGIHTESFSKAAEAAMRQDVDVIFVSEFRDPEAVLAALQAATTGTLVFGAVYAGSAAEAIDVAIDALPADSQSLARDMLAESLQAVVVQELLPEKNSKRRVPVCEVLLRCDGLADAVREGNAESLSSLIQSGRSDGMQAMDDALAELVEKDIIAGTTAHRKARDKDRFAKYAGDNRW